MQKQPWLSLVIAASVICMAASQASADSAYTWGGNTYGQLGDGTTMPDSAPGPVNNMDATVVTAGYEHSLAIKNGSVWAWGLNSYGQLGNGTSGTSYNSSVPVQVTGITSGATAVAGGYGHSSAIQNGGVKAWGYNYYGQLGNGTATGGWDTPTPTPVQVTGLTSGTTAIAGGGYHNLALQSGSVKAWGNNWYGQLGNGTTIHSYVPVQVTGLTSGVTAIAGGYYHNLALQNGSVKAWGYNGYGQLGNGSITSRNAPVQVTGLTSGVWAIAGGTYHSLALKNDGTVWAWGRNYYGQLGDGTTTDRNVPVQVNGLANIVAIAAGDYSSYAISANGSIWSWGLNSSGQLGLRTTGGNYSTPQQLPGGYMFTSISAGGYHVLARVAGCIHHPADFDSSCAVDATDVVFMLSCFTGPEGSVSQTCQAADLNNDGAVDMADFAILQRCLASDMGLLDFDCVN